jgi:hypothetical protein
VTPSQRSREFWEKIKHEYEYDDAVIELLRKLKLCGTPVKVLFKGVRPKCTVE